MIYLVIVTFSFNGSFLRSIILTLSITLLYGT